MNPALQRIEVENRQTRSSQDEFKPWISTRSSLSSKIGRDCSGSGHLPLLFPSAKKKKKNIEIYESKLEQTIKTWSLYTDVKHSRTTFKLWKLRASPGILSSPRLRSRIRIRGLVAECCAPKNGASTREVKREVLHADCVVAI